MGIFFLVRKSFLIKISEIVEGSFGNPAVIFVSKVWEVTAHSPKKKEIDKYSNKFFPEIGSSGHFWIQIGHSNRKFSCNKPAPIIAWNPWMWSADFNQKNFPKTPFRRVKCINDNPAENSAHEVRKHLLGVGENRGTVYFQNFFIEFIIWSRRMPF